MLRVKSEQVGWLTYRDDCVMIQRGQSAVFSTPEEAQRVADAHYRDGYPNSEFVFDGSAWSSIPDPWWSYPGRVLALRGKLAA